MISLFPVSIPVDCGPPIPLPPLKPTASTPREINFVKFSRGGNSAAASRSTGRLFLCAISIVFSNPMPSSKNGAIM